MDHKTLFEKYTRSWYLMRDGSKQVKNDLAGVRRTRTSLQKMLTADFEQVLQPEHMLALRAAASVLNELDQSLARLPRLVDAEQKRQQAARAARDAKGIDDWISARSGEGWTLSDEAADAEARLLDEFRAVARDWIPTQRPESFENVLEGKLYSGDKGVLSEPDKAHVAITTRQRLAIRLSLLPAKGSIDTGWRSDELIYRWGQEDFRAWKAWRGQVAGAISKALAKA